MIAAVVVFLNLIILSPEPLRDFIILVPILKNSCRIKVIKLETIKE